MNAFLSENGPAAFWFGVAYMVIAAALIATSQHIKRRSQRLLDRAEETLARSQALMQVRSPSSAPLPPMAHARIKQMIREVADEEARYQDALRRMNFPTT